MSVVNVGRMYGHSNTRVVLGISNGLSINVFTARSMLRGATDYSFSESCRARTHTCAYMYARPCIRGVRVVARVWQNRCCLLLIYTPGRDETVRRGVGDRAERAGAGRHATHNDITLCPFCVFVRYFSFIVGVRTAGYLQTVIMHRMVCGNGPSSRRCCYQ